MTLPDQTPNLPKWPFLVADATLLAVAFAIHHYSRDPFTGTPLVAIVGCVFAAALLGAIPFLADYARKQDEALDDRQRALEALARTVTSSAEQISIAANGLNDIAELIQKSLRHADHLPQKLHEKVAEMQALLATVNDAEKEELEREVAALRTTESDRLEAASDKIAKSTGEWTRLEAATQKHLAAANEALAKAAAAAEQSLAKTQAQAATVLDEKLSTALTALDAKLAACTELVGRALEASAKKITELPVTAPASAAVTPEVSLPDSPADAPAVAEATIKPEGAAHPPKRPRKPRHTEPAPEEPAAADPSQKSEIENQKLEEPPPVPLEKIPEVAPVAPHTANPFVDEALPAPPGESAPSVVPSASEPDPQSAIANPKSEKPPRKRAPKKPAPAAAEGEPALGLIEPPATAPSAEVVERVVSADGATRLLVTAYIGIGNRLFIRGEGPGLSWEKGVPLQFVSIGKWRWETANATAPVKFKLYKNDDVECAALGTQSLDPGHQEEVTAAF